MHNGVIRDFSKVKRDLVFAVDPSLYPSIEGSTGSEVFFYLALTMGLADRKNKPHLWQFRQSVSPISGERYTP